MNEKLEVISLECTSACECPSQWEGITSCRKKLYFRYEEGYLSIEDITNEDKWVDLFRLDKLKKNNFSLADLMFWTQKLIIYNIKESDISQCLKKEFSQKTIDYEWFCAHREKEVDEILLSGILAK